MKRLKMIIGLLIIVVVFAIYYMANTSKTPVAESEFKVTKFENMYEGNNIKFYYDNLENIAYVNLKEKYNLDENITKEKDNIKKLELLSTWIKGEDRDENKVEIKSSAQYITGDESLVVTQAFTKGFANDKDFNTVFAIMARTLGFQTRVVEFYQNTDNKAPTLLTLTEIYFEDLKKWVLYDAVNNMSFTSDVPLSAIEVVEQGVNKIKNLKSGKEYIEKYGKYFDAIRIPIDSRVYDGKKLNGYLMYSKDEGIPQMIYVDIELDATVFTKNTKLFSYLPVEAENNHEDNNPTLVFSIKEEKENKKKKQEGKVILYGSAFKNSSNLNSFYIRINDAEYKEVNKNFKYEIAKGAKVTIYLSEDGKNSVREVAFQF